MNGWRYTPISGRSEGSNPSASQGANLIPMPSSEVMPKFYRGTLRSSSGQKVTNPLQAKAIAVSERQNEKKHGGVYEEGGIHRRTRKLSTRRETMQPKTRG